MRADIEVGFNPFYDSQFYISVADKNIPDNRLLVELYEDELLRLRNEINYILKHNGVRGNKFEEIIQGLINDNQPTLQYSENNNNYEGLFTTN